MILVAAWLAVGLVLIAILVWRLAPRMRRPEKPVGIGFALTGLTLYGVMTTVFALHGQWMLAIGHLVMFAIFGRLAIIARRSRRTSGLAGRTVSAVG